MAIVKMTFRSYGPLWQQEAPSGIGCTVTVWKSPPHLASLLLSSSTHRQGTATYRGFSHPIEKGIVDGPHVLKLNIESKGVVIHANRTYDITFNLGRSSITLKSLTILYDGATAQPGLEASSIGRFGVKMDGGTGLGFAEEIK